jgi:hypothetical protein
MFLYIYKLIVTERLKYWSFLHLGFLYTKYNMFFLERCECFSDLLLEETQKTKITCTKFLNYLGLRDSNYGDRRKHASQQKLCGFSSTSVINCEQQTLV